MKAISLIFKVLAWICIVILVIGGPSTLIHNNFNPFVFVAASMYGLLAWLFFWIAKKLKQKSCKKDSSKE